MAEAAAGEPDCAGDDLLGDVVVEVMCGCRWTRRVWPQVEAVPDPR